MSARLSELIEKLYAGDPEASLATMRDALTEIDRRLTALEERTAPPLSGNEVTTNLLAAAEESRAKAVEDGLAVLEGRTAITCTCRRMYSWDGTFHGISPEPDGCPMHGNRPEDVAARERWAAEHRARVGVEQVQNCPHSAQDWRIEGGEMWCDECDRAKFTPQMGTPFGDYPSLQAYLAANKALVGAMAKHMGGESKQGAESEPAEDDRAKLRARVDAAGAEFTAHVACGGPPLTPRAMYERAHALTLDGDTDNGAGVWELQEECVREGWETLFEEATQGEREAHALLDRVITEAARTISPELRADIDRALDRARGGSST